MEKNDLLNILHLRKKAKRFFKKLLQEGSKSNKGLKIHSLGAILTQRSLKIFSKVRQNFLRVSSRKRIL